jgi:hypothetical protein
LIGGKLDEVEFDLSVSDDDRSHHEFGHSALFLQSHLRPTSVKIDCFRDDLFARKVIDFENIDFRLKASKFFI